MPLYKNKYRIKSTRLKDWDYSSDGYYYVTICTKNREYYFGDILDGKMILSKTGIIAEKCWCEIPDHFPFIVLDEYIIMPNHIHGIIQIKHDLNNDVGMHKNVETQDFASLRNPQNGKFGPQSKNLASIIRGFKIGITKIVNKNNIDFVWQPRYYDHIIRDEEDLNIIREYIINNPLNWDDDDYYKKG